MYPPNFVLENSKEYLASILENPQRSFYSYDIPSITSCCKSVSNFHSSIFQSRYAMKANTNSDILDIMKTCNIHIDACSEYEVYDAITSGFQATEVQLSAQQSPHSRSRLYNLGVSCICTSLSQLDNFCREIPGGNVGVRINPGQGSGQFQKINTGGNTSSFGIWHSYIDKALSISQKNNTKITKLHIHIGSGSDTQVRLDTFRYCLSLVEKFSNLEILNMGGGFKVARMPSEKQSNLPEILQQTLEELKAYNQQTGRHIKLEIEPGSYFVAAHGHIVSKVDDVVDTGADGYNFAKTTTGMDMILRPALYQAQHPIYHYSLQQQQWSTLGEHHYVIVGHCCESTDLLSPDSSGNISTRGFNQRIERGDIIVIGGCGAYCESMRCIGYNGF